MTLSVICTSLVTATLYRLYDAKNVLLRNGENGYLTAEFTLPRDFRYGYDDIAPGWDIRFIRGSGVAVDNKDTAFFGKVESFEQSTLYDNPAIKVSCTGKWATTYDKTFTGTIGSAAYETQIATFASATYCPELSTTTTSLAATGLTGPAYLTGNSGADEKKPGDIIKELCKAGTSTGQRVVPAVWADFDSTGKPRLQTTALPLLPTAKYAVDVKNLEGFSLRRAMSSIYNNVIAYYLNSLAAGARAKATSSDATSIATYGVTKTLVIDLTNQGQMTPTQAGVFCTAALTQYKYIRSDSDSIVVNSDYSIIDLDAGQEIPMAFVRSGNWIQLRGMLPRFSDTGSGTAAGDAALTSLVYVTQAEYNEDTGKLTLTPENSSDIANLIS